jgi:hypothetical protein
LAGMTVEAVALRLIATCSNERPDSIAVSLHGDDVAEVVTAALHGDVELDDHDHDHVHAVRAAHAGRVDAVELFGARQRMPWWGHIVLGADDPTASPLQQAAAGTVINDAYVLQQFR